MNNAPLRDNTTLSDRLQQLEPEAAEKATQMFLENHSEWLVKYGERARKLGIEDAQYHIEFLVGAVEADSTQVFENYCDWAARLLESRGIAKNFLVEDLTQIETALRPGLSLEEQTVVARFMEAGRAACNRETSGPKQPGPLISATETRFPTQ